MGNGLLTNEVIVVANFQEMLFYLTNTVFCPQLCSGLTILYTLRVNMSVAAQKMKLDLDWSETEKGFVLVSVCRFHPNELVQ